MQEGLRPVLNENSKSCINPIMPKPWGRKLSSYLHVGHSNIELMSLSCVERTETYQQPVKLFFLACSLYVSVYSDTVIACMRHMHNSSPEGLLLDA